MFRSALLGLALLLPGLRAAAPPPVASTDPLHWSKLSPLPDREGFAFPYAGISNGALLVAGGANFPDKKPWEGGAKVWYDTVFVLEKPDGAWQTAGRLPRPLGYGVSLTTSDGVACLGGSDLQRHYADCFLLRWTNGRLETAPLPPLPKPVANICGAQLGSTIYVAGGLETPNSTIALQTFWALDLVAARPQWRELEPWPGPGRMLATAAVQDKSFFLVGGTALAPDAQGKPVRTYLKDAYRYRPGHGWQRVTDLPHPVVAPPTPAPALDQSSFLILGGDDGSLVNFTPLAQHPGFPGRILTYHTITDTWRDSGKMPRAHVTTPLVRWGDTFVMPTGEVRPGVRSPDVWALRAAPQQAASGPKPNVLFIAVDDLRVSLGCYGDPLAKSPNIDRLAGEARMFTRAYTMQAVCGPARTAIMTGRLPDQTRVWHNRHLFRDTHPDTVTLPQLFKQHGYHAQGLGKTFSGDEREEDPASWSVPATLKAEGWKNYALPRGDAPGKQAPYEAADVPDEGYSDGKLAALAVETLGKLKQQGKPFFLAVGFFKPHLPFNAPKKYWDLHDPAKFDLPGEPQRVQGAPETAYHTHRELGGYSGMPKDERLGAAQTRTLRHGYYACVSYTDAQIGKVLAALQRHGLDQNTIVVLWGDHGYALGDAGRWCKGTNFELDARVPLMVRLPGMAQPGRPTASLIEYVDLYPTLAELAGLPAPAYLAGRSFAPILRDPAQPGREFALSQFSRPFNAGAPQAMGYTIRTATQRYTRWVDWPARQTTAEELYDYTAPGSAEPRWTTFVERRNLIDDPASSAARDRLRGVMDQVLRERSIVTPERPATDDAAKTPRKKKRQ